MNSPLAFIDNFERFTDLVGVIKKGLPAYTYEFMGLEESKKLLPRDVGAGNRIYVQELLFRSHWTALTAILRNSRWMQGIDAAMKYKNYFSFCACLRGMVESAADSHDALHLVMATLAEHHAAFKKALAAKFTEGIFCCEPLEEVLIHYTYARKIGKGQTAPSSHHAKTMQDYLTTLEEPGARSVRDLYAELCEVTHPAAATVHFFSRGNPTQPSEVKISEPEDMAFIVQLIGRHDAVFVPLFQKSFNAALLTLYILNRFDDSRIYTLGAEDVNFERVPAFAEIEAKMAVSRNRVGMSP